MSDRRASQRRTQIIPPVVYQTAESREVHPTHAKSIEAFRDLNPDLDFVLFDASARDSYIKSHWKEQPIADVYDRSVFGQMKADIFRYCIIYDRGGYYFDFNKGCEVPLSSLHSPSARGLVSYESTPEMLFPDLETATALQNPFNLVLQWGFAFAPGHRLLESVISRIVEIEPFFRGRIFAEPKKALLTMSAPGVFTDVLRKHVATNGLDGIEEAGIDFNGHGVFRLRGSKFLSSGEEYYGALSDKAIIRNH